MRKGSDYDSFIYRKDTVNVAFILSMINLRSKHSTCNLTTQQQLNRKKNSIHNTYVYKEETYLKLYVNRRKLASSSLTTWRNFVAIIGVMETCMTLTPAILDGIQKTILNTYIFGITKFTESKVSPTKHIQFILFQSKLAIVHLISRAKTFVDKLLNTETYN